MPLVWNIRTRREAPDLVTSSICMRPAAFPLLALEQFNLIKTKCSAESRLFSFLQILFCLEDMSACNSFPAPSAASETRQTETLQTATLLGGRTTLLLSETVKPVTNHYPPDWTESTHGRNQHQLYETNYHPWCTMTPLKFDLIQRRPLRHAIFSQVWEKWCI